MHRERRSSAEGKLKMTDSERAVEELRLALGTIDFIRATRAAVALQDTRTIDYERGKRLVSALGTIRDVMNSFPEPN
jgi:hypothetical protein